MDDPAQTLTTYLRHYARHNTVAPRLAAQLSHATAMRTATRTALTSGADRRLIRGLLDWGEQLNWTLDDPPISAAVDRLTGDGAPVGDMVVAELKAVVEEFGVESLGITPDAPPEVQELLVRWRTVGRLR